MKRMFCGGTSMLAVTFAAATLWAPAAYAATAAATPNTAEVSEVVVTGSLIQGTPENAALPVTVLTSDNLSKEGSPSIVELTKMLPESAGIVGDSNQFAAAGRGQGQYGSATINLRGLGPERTLTLFNGHRLPLAFGFAVDTKMLPLSAIGRVEVLKDGAAATYGSDAIGGVVNFITKRNYNGFEIGGDARYVPGTRGDYTVNATWGHTFGDWNFMVSAGYQHRSELDVLDRDWAHRRYDQNPEGGWTGGGNPESFLPAIANPSNNVLGPAGALIIGAGGRLDLGCTALGGQLTGANANAAPLLPWNSCRGQYSIWDALVEEENSVQVFGQADTSFGSNKLHVEVAYSYTNLPFFKSSPSYVTTRPVPQTVLPANDNATFLSFTSPTVNTRTYVPGTVPPHSFLYFVPVDNPGFQAYMNANPGQFPAGTVGAFLSVGTFRPFLTGGNPLYNYTHGVGGRYWHEQINLNAELKGDITSGLHYDASVTWGQYKYYAEGRDSLTDRLELALRGLGGPGCNFQTGTPGVGGCMWLNPFSNAIPGAPRNNLSNPGFNANVQNTAVLADWIMPIQTGVGNYQDLDADFTLSGEVPITLPGGDIGWAGGVQLRRNHFVTNASLFGNAKLAPCADAGLPGAGANCPANANPAAGPNVFGPVANPQNLTQNIYAAFGEFTVPINEAVNLDVAARYEDYGKYGGHTFNPQVRGKFKISDVVALRGSIGTTFRAPPQGFLIPDPAIGLQQVLGTFIPVASIGNPALKPETATTWSVGGIVETSNFHFTVDYWSYNFKKLLTIEPLGGVVTALFPNGADATKPNNCASLDPAFIASHFIFSGACSPSNVVAVNLQRINGPNIKTDGVDFNITYRLEHAGNGTATLGLLGTYVREYNVSSMSIGSGPSAVIIPGFNAAGFFNTGTVAYPIPKLKGQAFINYEIGRFNIRWTARYTSHYTDQRAALFAANAIYVTPTNPSGIVSAGQVVKSAVLHDVVVRVQMPYDSTVTLTVNNLFDKAPPFARTDLNYDALTGDPIGRTVKLGVQKRF
jgi:iron complex outermembrane receptor protein